MSRSADDLRASILDAIRAGASTSRDISDRLGESAGRVGSQLSGLKRLGQLLSAEKINSCGRAYEWRINPHYRPNEPQPLRPARRTSADVRRPIEPSAADPNRTTTQALLGDPLPGRSALDQRRPA